MIHDCSTQALCLRDEVSTSSLICCSCRRRYVGRLKRATEFCDVCRSVEVKIHGAENLIEFDGLKTF